MTQLTNWIRPGVQVVGYMTTMIVENNDFSQINLEDVQL
jgi:hypothetical protein